MEQCVKSKTKETTMADEPVLVFASFEPKAGQEEAVEAILKGMVGPTRQEPGNEIYDLYERKKRARRQTLIPPH